MTVRDEVRGAAVRIGLPPLELRSELARRCADGHVPDELVLAHTDLVADMTTGAWEQRPRGGGLPRGVTPEMLPPEDHGGYIVFDQLWLSVKGIEALAADAGIHLAHGKVFTVYTRAKDAAHPGVPQDLMNVLYEFLAHLAWAADNPAREVGAARQ